MTPKIIFIQGPPRSGKDAFGKLLAEQIPNSKIVKFAEILKNRTHALYGLSPLLPHYAFDATKDQPSPDFLGLTPRQAYIEVAERHFKRLHGARVFGDLLLVQIKKMEEESIVKHTKNGVIDAEIRVRDPVYLITDSGFVQEADVLVEHFGIERCVAFQVQREGKDFSNDSRGYWDIPNRTMRVYNKGTLDDLKVAAIDYARYLFPLTESTPDEPSSCHGPGRPASDR